MTSDTILASDLRAGDRVYSNERFNEILAVELTDRRVIVTLALTLRYRPNTPVTVDRIEFHNTKGASI